MTLLKCAGEGCQEIRHSAAGRDSHQNSCAIYNQGKDLGSKEVTHIWVCDIGDCESRYKGKSGLDKHRRNVHPEVSRLAPGRKKKKARTCDNPTRSDSRNDVSGSGSTSRTISVAVSQTSRANSTRPFSSNTDESAIASRSCAPAKFWPFFAPFPDSRTTYAGPSVPSPDTQAPETRSQKRPHEVSNQPDQPTHDTLKRVPVFRPVPAAPSGKRSVIKYRRRFCSFCPDRVFDEKVSRSPFSLSCRIGLCTLGD